jgi:hypothetical protein
MNTITLANIASASSAELVAFYNSRNTDKPVKKFADRKTAEKRVSAIIEAEAANGETVKTFAELNAEIYAKKEENRINAEESSEENENNVRAFAFESEGFPAFRFPKASDFIEATTAITRFVPEGFSSIFNPVKPIIESAIYSVEYKESEALDGLSKVISIYEGGSEEEAKAFYSNATVNLPSKREGVLTLFKDGEEVYSDIFDAVDESEEEREETAEEEAERIEAEANAENEAEANAENEADTYVKRAPKGRRSNSEGVAISWLDKEVREARLKRDGVSVRIVGSESVSLYRSTAEAFRNLRLDFSKHIRFRLSLKASRREIIEFDGVKYEFSIIEASE